MKIPRCPNRDCRSSGQTVSGNVIRFGFYQTRWGKRRRYRCQTCAKTFCSNSGTPYYRLQHRRTTFDQVAALSVEGLNKSAIARVERIGWNTVDRWLEKASDCGRRFNDQEITGFRATELQADEIRTITQAKQQPTWIFAAIEVWSRLWSSTVVGRRSYQNTLALFRDIAERANPEDIPLITTDGFEFYERVIGQVFGPACVYGQVIKTRRNNRIVKVERRAVIGAEGAIRGKTAAVRGLLNTEHVVYRTVESDDPARLRVSLPEDDMSRPLEATSGRASGITSVLLQFRPTASGAEIRPGSSDAGYAGGIDRKAPDVTRDLLFGSCLLRMV
jgi:transposase-like protein/IS1 family transposase